MRSVAVALSISHGMAGLLGLWSRKCSALKQGMISLILAVIMGMVALLCVAQAEPMKMTDPELAAITGQGTTNLYIEDDTVRLFLDVHIETYGTIDSAKAGYYRKDESDFLTLKNNIGYPNEVNSSWAYIKDSSGTIIIKGEQGYIGNVINTVDPAINTTRNSYDLTDYANTNHYDWDMNWKNVTLGESMDSPLVIDGLVIRTEFDDISSPEKKLKRIVIGTNNMVGTISGDFARTTGAIHPSVPVDESNTLEMLGNDPIVVNRDSILKNWTSLYVNGGFFLELNLDGASSEKGIRTIIGYRESEAVQMRFAGGDWWSN